MDCKVASLKTGRLQYPLSTVLIVCLKPMMLLSVHIYCVFDLNPAVSFYHSSGGEAPSCFNYESLLIS